MYLTISGHESSILLDKLNLQHNSCHCQEFPVSWGWLVVMHKPHAPSPPHCPSFHADLNHGPCKQPLLFKSPSAGNALQQRPRLLAAPARLTLCPGWKEQGAPGAWAGRWSWCPSLLKRRGLRHFPLHKHTEQPELGDPAAVSAASACYSTSRHTPLSWWKWGNKLQYTIMQLFIKKSHQCLILCIFLCIKYVFSPTKPAGKELQQLEGPGFAVCGIWKNKKLS